MKKYYLYIGIVLLVALLIALLVNWPKRSTVTIKDVLNDTITKKQKERYETEKSRVYGLDTTVLDAEYRAERAKRK